MRFSTPFGGKRIGALGKLVLVSSLGGALGCSAADGGEENVGTARHEIRDCSSIGDWAPGTYAGGDLVKYRGRVFECMPWPQSGWCGQVGYEPGVSLYWENAWTEIDTCIGGDPQHYAACGESPAWSPGAYSGGEIVEKYGDIYECRGYPYNGWCGQEAYEPVDGWAWELAWTKLGACTDSCPEDDNSCKPWTQRHVYGLRGISWRSYRDQSPAQLKEKLDLARETNQIPINISGKGRLLGVDYSLVVRENTDGRDWKAASGLTSEQFQQKWDELRDAGYRLLDTEAYFVAGVLQFAGIWIENREGLAFGSRRNIRQDEFDDYMFGLAVEGTRTPIDIELYTVDGELRYSVVVWERHQGQDNILQKNLTREAYQAEVNRLRAEGWVMVDYEAYLDESGEEKYAAIWTSNPDGVAYSVRTRRSQVDHSNEARRHLDAGYRVVDAENHDVGPDDHYSGIYIETERRLRYPERDDMERAVGGFLTGSGEAIGLAGNAACADANPPPAGGVPDLDNYEFSQTVDCVPPPMGVSIVVLKDGETIYQRGVGLADRASGRIAYGHTVYSTASVAKAIGGTLSQLIQENAEAGMYPGRENFNLADPVRDYVTVVPKFPEYLSTELPDGHDYNFLQLLSHDACIAHYQSAAPPADVFPASFSQHCSSATQALTRNLAFVVGTDGKPPLMPGCQIGDGWAPSPPVAGTIYSDYSTAGFTYAAAGLEGVTGKTIQELVREELNERFGLSSLRVAFEEETMPDNEDRARQYLTNWSGSAECSTLPFLPNTPKYCERTQEDNSWKVLGGGLEISARDLARFGHLTMTGQIVQDTNRLFDSRRFDATGNPLQGTNHAIGWRTDNLIWTADPMDPTREIISGGFAHHRGDWNGASTIVRLYPADGVVIAIMANTRNAQSPSGPGQPAVQSVGNREWLASELAAIAMRP